MPDEGTVSGIPATAGLLDRLPCGVVVFEDDGRITAINATLLDRLGYAREALVGQHVERIFAVATRIFFQTHLFPLVRLHGHAEELFVLLRGREGEDIGALLNAVRSGHEGRQQTVLAVMEVRERRKYEDALLAAKRAAEAARAELEAANQRLEEQAVELEVQATELDRARLEAEEANRAKSQFLAVMSHELRTPLNAIGGYVQILELGIHGPVTDGQRDALDRIMRGQRHLLRLINDVLNLSRIEAGRVEYARDELVVADLVDAVMPMVEPQLHDGRLASKTAAPRALRVRADGEKVQQVLINLLTNAIRFTEPGGTISVVAEPAGGERVAIHVIDTGVGITTEHLATIFEPFVQVDTAPARRREGSGLGLAISRDLARGMGGDLVAQSEPGRGSTFTLLLPSA